MNERQEYLFTLASKEQGGKNPQKGVEAAEKYDLRTVPIDHVLAKADPALIKADEVTSAS